MTRFQPFPRIRVSGHAGAIHLSSNNFRPGVEARWELRRGGQAGARVATGGGVVPDGLARTYSIVVNRSESQAAVIV